MAKGGNTPRIEVALTMGAAWTQSVKEIKAEFDKTFEKPLEAQVDINRKLFDSKIVDIKKDLEALSSSKLITLQVDDAKAVESVKNIGTQLSKYFSDNVKPVDLDNMLNADGAIANLKALSDDLKSLTKEYKGLLEVSNAINKAGMQMAKEQASDKQIQSMTGGVEAFIQRLNALSKAYVKFYEAADGKKLTPHDYGNALIEQFRKMSELGKVEVGFIGTLSPETKALIKSELNALSEVLNAEGARIKVQAELVDYKQLEEGTMSKPIPVKVYPRIDLDEIFKGRLSGEIALLNKEIKDNPAFQIKLGINEKSFSDLESFKTLLNNAQKGEKQESLVDFGISDSAKSAAETVVNLSKAVKALSKGLNTIDFSLLQTALDELKTTGALNSLFETLDKFSKANVSAEFEKISSAIYEMMKAAERLNGKTRSGVQREPIINLSIKDDLQKVATLITNLAKASKQLSAADFGKIDFTKLQTSLESFKGNETIQTFYETLNQLAHAGISGEFKAIAKSVKEIAAEASNFNSVMSKSSAGQKKGAKKDTKAPKKTSQPKKAAEPKVEQPSYKTVVSDFNKLKTAIDAFDVAIEGNINNPFIQADSSITGMNTRLEATKQVISEIEALIAKGDLKSASEKLGTLNSKSLIDGSKAAVKSIKQVQAEEDKLRQKYLAQGTDKGAVVNTKPFEEQIAKIIKLRTEFESLKKTMSDSRLMEMGYITKEKENGVETESANRAKYEAEIDGYIAKLNAAVAEVKKAKENLEAGMKPEVDPKTGNERVKSAEEQAAALQNAAESMQKIELSGEGTAKKLKAMRTEGEQTAKIAERAEKAVVNIQKALENPRIKGTTYETQLKQLLDRATKNTGAETANINAELARINMQIQKAGLAVDTFGNKLMRTLSARLRAAISGSGLILVSQGFREIYQNVKDVDAAMTELRKVTDATNSEFVAFLDGASDRAQKLGGSLADVVSATADYSRLGYSLKEATDLADVAIMSKNVWDEVDNIDDVTSSLISTMKGFGIEAENAIEISDKFNEVANNWPTSAGAISEGMLRSASALSAAGNTLDEGIALFTAGQSVVQNAESMGTILKTTTMRIRGAETELEEAGLDTEGMASSVSKLRDELMALTGGFDIMKDGGQTFKSTYDILKGIAEVWPKLTDIGRANILELLAGKRNGNALAAILENFDIAEGALQSSQNSAGSVIRENEVFLDSINGKLEKLQANWETFSNDFLDSQLVKTALDLAGGFLNITDKIVENLGLIPGILTTIFGLMSAKAEVNLFGDLSKDQRGNKTVGQQIGSNFQKFWSGQGTSGKLISRADAAVITEMNDFFAKGETEKAAKSYDKLSKKLQDTNLVAKDGSTSFKQFGKQAYIAGTGLQGLATSAGAFIKGIGAMVPQMLAFMAISAGISKVIELVANNTETSAEKIENMENAVSNYNNAVSESKDNIQAISDLSDEFDTLAKGVNSAGENIGLNADEYDRYHEIINQIVELCPELVRSYDEEGNAIVNRNSLIEDAIHLQKEYQNAAKESYIANGQDIIDGTVEKLKDNTKEIKKEVLNKASIFDGFIFKEDVADKYGLNYAAGNYELTADNMQRIAAQEEMFLADYKKFLKDQGSTQEEIQAAIDESKSWFDNYGVLQNEQKEILQPVISWLKTALASDSELAQIPDEFSSIIDAKLEDLAKLGGSRLDMLDSAKRAINDLNKAAQNPEVQKYADQIEELNDSVNNGGLSAAEYESKAKSLKAAIEEYGAAAGQTDESLKDLCSTMANSINLHYEDAVQSINEAFNPLIDTLEEAKNAKADFDAAMEATGDYNDGVKSFREMLTEVYGEKDKETKKYNSEELLGNGSNAFWQAAEQTLGSDRLEQLKYDFAAVNKEVQEYYEKTSDGAKATNYLVDLLKNNMGEINKVLGEGTVWTNADGTLGFDIDKSDFPELADVLGKSDAALAALFENAKQFGDVRLFDSNEVKRAIEASESAFTGSNKTYMNYNTLLQESGMSDKEFYNAADYIETLDVKLIKANTDSKELAAALVDIDDSIGKKTADGYELNFDKAVAQLSNMGFAADDITQMMGNLDKDKTIKLDVTANKEAVQQQLDEFAKARELINSDLSDDELVNSLDNLKMSVDTLAMVLGDKMPDNLNLDVDKFNQIESGFDDTYGKRKFEALSQEDQDSLTAYNSKLRDTALLMKSMEEHGWSKTDIEKQFGIDDLDRIYDFYQKLAKYTGEPLAIDFDTKKVDEGIKSSQEKVDAFQQNYAGDMAPKIKVAADTDEATNKVDNFQKEVEDTVDNVSKKKVEIKANNKDVIAVTKNTDQAVDNTINKAKGKSVPIKGNNKDALKKISVLPTKLDSAKAIFRSNPLEIAGEDKTGKAFNSIWAGWRTLIAKIKKNPANGQINISGRGNVKIQTRGTRSEYGNKNVKLDRSQTYRGTAAIITRKKKKKHKDSNLPGYSGSLGLGDYSGLSSGGSSSGGGGGADKSSSSTATNRMDELLARLQTESGYTKKNRTTYTSALNKYKRNKKLTKADYKKYLHEFYKLKSDKIIESYEWEKKGYAKSKVELKKFAKAGKMEWSEYYQYVDQLDEARVERAKKRLDDDLGRLSSDSGNSDVNRARWWKDYNTRKKYLDASERKEYKQKYYDYRAGEYVNTVSEGRGNYQKTLTILKNYVNKKRITWEQYYAHLDELEEASTTKVNNDIATLEQYISDQDLFKTWAKGESAVTVWKKALEDLRKEFEAGTISLAAYSQGTAEVYRKLKQAEADLYGEKIDYTQSLIDLVKEMIKQEKQDQIDALNKQLDKYNEIIEAKKKSLELTRKETEHQETLEDYIKQISELQTQADMLALDDSREGKAKRSDILDQIGDLQKELNKYQRDYGLDQTEDMLDDLDESYGKYIDEQTKAIEDTIKYEGDLVKLAMERIQNTNFDALFKQLDDYNYKYGDGLLKTTEELKTNVASAFAEGGWLSDTGYLNTSLHLILDQLTALQNAVATEAANSNNIGDFNDLDDYRNEKEVSPIISGMRENYNKIQGLRKQGYSIDSPEINRLVLENNALAEKLQKLSATKTGTYSHLGAVIGDPGNYTVGLNNQGNASRYTGKSIYDTISAETAIDKDVGYARTPTAIINEAKKYKPVKKDDPGWKELVELKNELKTVPGYENAMVSKLNSKGKVIKAGYYKLKDKITGRYYYHTGLEKGFVGDGASLKQNEVYRVLTNDELVMNKNDQLRIGSQLEVLGKFIDALNSAKTVTNTPAIMRPAGEIRLEVNAPITIEGSVDSAVISELNKVGDKIADKALVNLEEVLIRSGYKVNASINAFKK